MNETKKKILIVDDHPVLRRGLAALIESEHDLVVCGETATCREALKILCEQRPDLVFVDLVLEDCYGLDLVKDMKTRHPDIPALVISMHNEAAYAERCLRAGARGYVNKQQLVETVLIAIHCLLAGETYLSEPHKAHLAVKFVDGKVLDTNSPLDVLSDRELQVFRLIGQGRSTRQIAEALHRSIKTIEAHREHIKHKLSIKSTAELAQRATQWVESDRSC